MQANTASTLSRGMEALTEKLGIVEAERFIFLVKSETFDYTQWQRDCFGQVSKAEMDAGMDAYFAAHPFGGDVNKVI